MQFLDWDNYSQWTKLYVLKCVEPGKQPKDLQPGDKITLQVEGNSAVRDLIVIVSTDPLLCIYDLRSTVIFLTCHPILQENTPEAFEWEFNAPFGVLFARHRFGFESGAAPGLSMFVNGEKLTGLVSFTLGPSWSTGKMLIEQFGTFNSDLKKAAENATPAAA